jgi:hypothetical protein
MVARRLGLRFEALPKPDESIGCGKMVLLGEFHHLRIDPVQVRLHNRTLVPSSRSGKNIAFSRSVGASRAPSQTHPEANPRISATSARLNRLPRISAVAEARNISTLLAARSPRVCDPGLAFRLAIAAASAARIST